MKTSKDSAAPPIAHVRRDSREGRSHAVNEHDEEVVAVSNVSHSFPQEGGHPAVEVLKDVGFAVNRGEIVTVVGPSGCGKTTLLRVLAGLLKPISGSVQVLGADVTSPGQHVGVVFQNDRLLPWRSVARNVAIGLEARGDDKKSQAERVGAVLDMVGLSQAEHMLPHQLSGGMRQRVNLARAFAIEPAILLMDEPFASLDAQTREFMQAEFLGMVRQSTASVVFITHQIDEAVYLGDRVLVLSGRPAGISSQMRVPFVHPRSLELKMQPEFIALVSQAWRELGAVSTSHWEAQKRRKEAVDP